MRGTAGTRVLIGRGLGGRDGVDGVWRSGGVKRESLDPDLHGELADGESFDGDHHPTVGRTRRQGHTGGRVVDGGCLHRWWIHTERVSTGWQALGTAPRCREAVQANPDEALREHVEAEAPEEFLSAEVISRT